MKNLRILLLMLLFAGLYSCNSTRSKIDELSYSEFQKKGNEITNLSQAILLSKVGNAIRTGGPNMRLSFVI